MRSFHPKGKRLPALERAILKYRAFEMMIILFQVEEIKAFVLGAIRATDRQRLPARTKKLYEKMWAILVSDGMLSQAESDDLQSLIDYRNQIAHSIQELTSDISRDDFAADHIGPQRRQYDHGALKRLEHYREQLSRKMGRRYILPLSVDHLLFESAEETYRQEIRRLGGRIRRLIEKRNRENDVIRSELQRIDKRFLKKIDPGHPGNVLRNGQLSDKGIGCCHSLFQHGLSDMAISHLMRISYASIRDRRKRWTAGKKS